VTSIKPEMDEVVYPYRTETPMKLEIDEDVCILFIINEFSIFNIIM
jgi:hypothetical protein